MILRLISHIHLRGHFGLEILRTPFCLDPVNPKLRITMRVLAFLSFLVTVRGNEVDSTLQSDDQCVSAECSFNALQLRGLKEEMELEKEMDEAESESGWLKDISTKTKNHFKHILAPLQKPIVTNYQYLTVLDSYVNYTMQKVENATGHLVVWNRKSLLQTDDACIKLGAVFPPQLKQFRRKVLCQREVLHHVCALPSMIIR